MIKNYGDDIYESEIEGVERIKLTEDDDPDCGHATLIRYGNQWIFGFDFIYNGLFAQILKTISDIDVMSECKLGFACFQAYLGTLPRMQNGSAVRIAARCRKCHSLARSALSSTDQ